MASQHSSEIKVSLFKRKRTRFFQMQYRDPVTGNKQTRSAGTTVRRDAERAAGKWEKELNEGRGQNLGRVAWSDFRTRYEDQVLSGLADKTDEKATGVFNVFESVINPQRLRDVTEEVIGHYESELRKLGRAESTIKGHLSHLQAAMNWAADQRMIPAAPKVRMPKRAKTTKVMKGRPITTEELERMIAKIGDELFPENPVNPVQINRDESKVDSWEHMLWGLWWSGLRLGESMELHWTDESKLHVVDLDKREPLLWVPGELEKGNKDRLMPIAPEFAEWLRQTPEGDREGYVFDPRPRRQRYSTRLSSAHVGRTISKFGKAAGVKVADGKFASAHDLRRAFGERWSSRVMPQVLMELMRHEDIATTMKFYVGQNAKRTSTTLWTAYHDVGGTLGGTQNSSRRKSLQGK